MVTDFAALLRDENRRHRAALAAWRAAVLSGDEDKLGEAFVAVAHQGILARAFRAAARLPGTPEATRQHMLWRWWKDGDSIRSEVASDLVLIAGLRALLPPYDGPAVTLWRGDSWFNRCRRTYGISWSSRRDVAERFATGMYQTFAGGSVVVEASVPAAAIICSVDPHLRPDQRGERGQISHEAYRATVEQS